MKNNIKFIDSSVYSNCWTCNGKGKINNKKCNTCKGSGKWKEVNYFLIYENRRGQKIAFNVDGIK